MMKFKLSFSEPQYFINEQKKTVTCKMKYSLKSTDYNLFRMFLDIAYWSKTDEDLIEYETIATAKLDPLDTFDPEIGKKVARAKAESFAYKRVSKQMLRIYNKYNLIMGNAVNELCIKSKGVQEHNDKYLSQFYENIF